MKDYGGLFDSWLPAGCFDQIYYSESTGDYNLDEQLHIYYTYDQNVKIYTNIRPTNQ